VKKIENTGIRDDVYLDRASDALRELQEEYNSLTC